MLMMEARRQGIIQSGGEVLIFFLRNVNNDWGFNTIFLMSLEILYMRTCLSYWTAAQWAIALKERRMTKNEDVLTSSHYPLSHYARVKKWRSKNCAVGGTS